MTLQGRRVARMQPDADLARCTGQTSEALADDGQHLLRIGPQLAARELGAHRQRELHELQRGLLIAAFERRDDLPREPVQQTPLGVELRHLLRDLRGGGGQALAATALEAGLTGRVRLVVERRRGDLFAAEGDERTGDRRRRPRCTGVRHSLRPPQVRA